MKGALAVLLPLILVCGRAHAHAASDAFLDARVYGERVALRLDLSLRDLDRVLALDSDGDGRLIWGELRGRRAEVFAYSLANLALDADGEACATEPGALAVDSHAGGAYAVLELTALCPHAPRALGIEYGLFFAGDALHRGLLRLSTSEGTSTAVFAPGSRHQTLALDGSGGFRRFAGFVREGIHHIGSGADHVLFLCSLLLPAVLVRRAGGWSGAPRAREVALDVLRVVTGFTLAHSLTLSLAALGVVSAPSRWVESIIAGSVLAAALANLWPKAPRLGARFAFGFGLVHGLGFASALSGLDLAPGARVATLLGFNLGVELGQLAIVALLLPLAYALRGTAFYQRGVLTAGSLVIAGLSLVWLVERSLGF